MIVLPSETLRALLLQRLFGLQLFQRSFASRRLDIARTTCFRELVNEGRTLPSALLPSAWKPLTPSRQFCCQQCPLSGWRIVDNRESRAEDPSPGQSLKKRRPTKGRNEIAVNAVYGNRLGVSRPSLPFHANPATSQCYAQFART